MKTLKTFLAEAPKVESMYWKDAFKMLIFHAIETESENLEDDIQNVKKAYTDEVQEMRSEAESEWDDMDEDEKENYMDDFDQWFEGEYFPDNEGDLSVGYAANSVKMKSAVGEDLFSGGMAMAPPPMYGDNGESGFDEVVRDQLTDEADDWAKMILDFGGFGGAGKQMAIDAKKKLKTDWKMIDPDKLAKDVANIFLGYTKTTANDAISKLMLKPNFGINADKKEWANFCKKPETYDKKWWVSLQKEFGKYT